MAAMMSTTHRGSVEEQGERERGREGAWYIATDFRRLIENERSNISAWSGPRPDNLCGHVPVLLLLWTLFNGNRFTLCGQRIVLENITHKQERNPKGCTAAEEGRGIYRKFRGHYYLWLGV